MNEKDGDDAHGKKADGIERGRGIPGFLNDANDGFILIHTFCVLVQNQSPPLPRAFVDCFTGLLWGMIFPQQSSLP